MLMLMLQSLEVVVHPAGDTNLQAAKRCVVQVPILNARLETRRRGACNSWESLLESKM